MSNFILLAKSKNFAEMSSTVCATGGGATKFAALTEKVGLFRLRTDPEISLICPFNLIFNLGTCYGLAKSGRNGIPDQRN
jgi:hypothetical protein